VVLAAATLLVCAVMYGEHWMLAALNMRLDNLGVALLPYAAFTALGIIVLAGTMKMLGLPASAANPYVLFFAWSLPIGAVQEFLYRGFLMRELHRLYASITVVIIINALLFMMLHILYNPPFLILPLTFLAGLGFAWMYEKYPNLFLIALSHGVLNFFALKYGFF
jgi:membrane protease YdiL (CAAX protease family)